MSDIINYYLEAGTIKGTLDTETGEFTLEYNLMRDGSDNIISSGRTPDWEAGQAPWYESRELIKQIKLIDLIYLGSFAFYNCTNVKKIIISESLTEIGVNAFDLNSNPDLASTGVEYNGTIKNWCNIKFNNSLANPLMALGNLYLSADEGKVLEQLEITADIANNINDFAFNGSTISSLIIYSASIGSYAFANCSRLQYIAIAPRVTAIGDYAFNECPSATIYVAASSPKAISDWSASWNAGNNPVVWGAKNKGIYTDENIIDGILFWEQSFDDKISIIKYLYTGSSSNNKSITIELPETINGCLITSIGISAFSDAPITTFDASATAVSVIKEGAFNKCTKLQTCKLPTTIKSIGNFAFKQCFKLTTVNLEADVQELGIGVFNQCYSLNRYEEGKVEGCYCSVDNAYFCICDIPVKLSSEAKISAICKKSVPTGTIHIVHCLPNTLLTAMKSLEVEEPQNNKELAILFTDFVEVILEDYAFSSCLNTKQDDYKLDLIFAAYENYVIGVNSLSIGTSAFESAPIRDITLKGNKDHTFNNNAFKDCYKLRTISYYGALSDWCNITFTNKYSNPLYYDVNDKGQYTKQFVPYGDSDPTKEWGEIVVIDGNNTITLSNIARIPDCTFINQPSIEILNIDSDCYLTIGEAAFKNNTALREINPAKENILKAKYIARSAFEGCHIEDLTLEASADNPLVILDYAFCGGNSCHSFSLSKYTSYVGHYAFDQFLTLSINTALPEYAEPDYKTQLKVCTRYLKNFDTKYVTHLHLIEDDTSLPQNIDWPNLTALSLDFTSATNINMLKHITPSTFDKCKKFNSITVYPNNSMCKYFTISNCLYQHLADQVIELIYATNNSSPSQVEGSYPNSIIKLRDGAFRYRYFKGRYPDIPKNTTSISSTIFSDTTIYKEE
jgi:hypothetical protein